MLPPFASFSAAPAYKGHRSRLFSWLIFLLPAVALTTHYGVGFIEAAILFSSLFYAKVLWQQRAVLFDGTGFIIGAFAFKLAIAVISLAFYGWSARYFDNQFRQLLLMPAIGLIVLMQPNPKAFWYGLFAGIFGTLCLAVYQRFWLQMDRASGSHLSIMFGDIAIAMGLMSLASAPLFEKTRLALLPYLAFIGGLLISILSGTRGAWVALPFCFIALYWQKFRVKRREILFLTATGLIIFLVLCFIPELGVAQRFADIANDIEQFRLGNVNTSIGLRFEMWRGAMILFIEHPLMGVGRANFNPGLLDLIARGAIDPALQDFYHAHNELFHVMATEGIVGAFALLLLYAAPLWFFIGCIQRRDASQAYAQAGLLLVLSFMCFGLTQVLFAHHIGTAFYAAAIGFIAGLCVLIRGHRHRAPIDVL
jgi:O-antigen ligase